MKRFSPFNGRQVSLQDATYWTIETANAVRERISDLYNYGVINGLTVFSSGTESGKAAVTLGTAYDLNGDRIRVPTLQDRLTYSGANLNAVAANYTIVARYVEGSDGVYGLDVDGASQAVHITDSFTVNVLKDGADSVQSADVRLSGVITTVVGGSLIIDANVRDSFSSKFQASLNINTSGLNVTGALIVGGTATFNDYAIFMDVIDARSDIHVDGDVYCDTSGKGVIFTSPDGTKQARILLGNDGFIAQEPLNYTLS